MRAALLATQAGPLAGDRDSVRIIVGAGATLVVEPVAATLALPGPSTTLLRLDVRVEHGGRLVLDEGPLIVAMGARVQRRCVIELQEGAVAALRETVVLGRDGEGPGALDASVRVVLAGRVLVHDGLRFGARAAPHVALAPGHRVAATACLLGMRDPTGMQLEGPGAMLRATGPSLAGVERTISAPWTAWSEAVLRSLVVSP